MTEQSTRDHLRALADKATEGPWYAERRPEDYYDLTTVYNVFHNGDTMDRDLVAEVAYDNAEFIAAARTALPQILDQLDRAEHRIARLEAQADIRGRAVVMYRERAREAETRIKAVRAIHRDLYESMSGVPYCDECDRAWPCPTIRALDN